MSEIVENNAPILDDAIPMDDILDDMSTEDMRDAFKKTLEYVASDKFEQDCEEAAKESKKSGKEIFIGTIKVLGNKIAVATQQAIEWTGNAIQVFCNLIKSVISKTATIIKKAYYAIKGFIMGLIHEGEAIA